MGIGHMIVYKRQRVFGKQSQSYTKGNGYGYCNYNSYCHRNEAKFQIHAEVKIII